MQFSPAHAAARPSNRLDSVAICRRTAGIALLAASVGAQPQFLADLNRELDVPASSSPESFAQRGSEVYFAATSAVVGRELWVASATGGTRVRYDLVAGTASSTPTEIVALGNGLAFIADVGQGRRVYYLDTTTNSLRSLQTGVSRTLAPSSLVVSGDRLFFFADDGATGQELWLSPTPGAPAQRIADMNPSGSTELAVMVSFGAGVAMIANDGTHGFELWVSDGTAAGTRLVRDLNPGSAWGASNTRPLVISGELFFGGDDGVHGNELFASDGNSVRLVVDIATGSSSSFPQRLVAAGPRLAFIASSPVGRRLFVREGGNVQIVVTTATVENVLGAASGRFWVVVADAAGRDIGVVDSGSTTLRRLGLGVGGSANVNPPLLALAGNSLYFETYTTGTHELRGTDGTVAGTRILAIGGRTPLGAIAGFNDGSAFFVFEDATHGRELWFTDGTPAGTRLFGDLDPLRPTQGSFPQQVGQIGGRALLTANVGRGRSLVATDGTARGTATLRNVNPGRYTALAPLNDAQLFIETSDIERLVRTDGTPAGTRVVANVGTLTAGAGVPLLSVDLDGGRVLFSGSTDRMTSQLWITDGTSAGTRVLATIDPTGRNPAYGFVRMGERAYFFATDGQGPIGLWSSDGTAAGTRLATNFPQNVELPRMLGVVGNRIVFATSDGQSGFEPWVTDGTVGGTTLLADLTPGAGSTTFLNEPPTVFAGRMLLRVASRLVSTDGTTAGTFALPSTNGFEAIAALDEVAYLVRATASSSLFLRTDGTLVGTTPVSFALPSGGAVARRISSSLFAIGVVGAFGQPGILLVSDGTAGGTRIVANNASGLLGPIDGGVIYTGLDPATGTEPWFVSIGATAQVAGVGCGVGTVPQLSSSEPRSGQTVVLRAGGLGTASALLLGVPLPTPLRVPLPASGCALFVDAAAVTVVLPPNGELRLPVPTGIEFAGARLAAQVASVDAALTLELSNGVRLTVGL